MKRTWDSGENSAALNSIDCSSDVRFKEEGKASYKWYKNLQLVSLELPNRSITTHAMLRRLSYRIARNLVNTVWVEPSSLSRDILMSLQRNKIICSKWFLSNHMYTMVQSLNSASARSHWARFKFLTLFNNSIPWLPPVTVFGLRCPSIVIFFLPFPLQFPSTLNFQLSRRSFLQALFERRRPALTCWRLLFTVSSSIRSPGCRPWMTSLQLYRTHLRLN